MEYKNKDKVGEIIDRRFGENDANMTVEDKMLERFMVEKKVQLDDCSLVNLMLHRKSLEVGNLII